MVSKALLVSAAAAGLLLAQPQSASAGVNVDVNVDVNAYPVQYYPDYPDYPSSRPYHNDDDYEDDDYDRIRCWEGRRIVRRAGYRDVRTLSCDGRIYRYSGWRRGKLWRISVSSRSGQIIRARISRPYY
jgi:hypothetical protein